MVSIELVMIMTGTAKASIQFATIHYTWRPSAPSAGFPFRLLVRLGHFGLSSRTLSVPSAFWFEILHIYTCPNINMNMDIWCDQADDWCMVLVPSICSGSHEQLAVNLVKLF